MDQRTLSWLDLLGRALLWGAVAVLGLAFIASVAIVTSDNIGFFQDNVERQGRGIVAIGAFSSGLAAAGVMAGLGALVRLKVAERRDAAGKK